MCGAVRNVVLGSLAAIGCEFDVGVEFVELIFELLLEKAIFPHPAPLRISRISPRSRVLCGFAAEPMRMSAPLIAARNRPSAAGSLKSDAPKCSSSQGCPVFSRSPQKARRIAFATHPGPKTNSRRASQPDATLLGRPPR